MVRRVLFGTALIALTFDLQAPAQEKALLSIDASKTGAKISGDLFGQFAETPKHAQYKGSGNTEDAKTSAASRSSFNRSRQLGGKK